MNKAARIEEAFQALEDLRDRIKAREGQVTPAEKAEIAAMITIIEEPGTIKALWEEASREGRPKSRRQSGAWLSPLCGNA